MYPPIYKYKNTETINKITCCYRGYINNKKNSGAKESGLESTFSENIFVLFLSTLKKTNFLSFYKLYNNRLYFIVIRNVNDCYNRNSVYRVRNYLPLCLGNIIKAWNHSNRFLPTRDYPTLIKRSNGFWITTDRSHRIL